MQLHPINDPSGRGQDVKTPVTPMTRQEYDTAYRPVAYAYAIKLLHDDKSAEWVADTVISDLWEKRGGVPKDRQNMAFLLLLARIHTTDLLRDRARERQKR